MTINWQALAVFIVVFGSVTMLGFFASRWKQGDLNRLQEWGLAGRRFGTLTSWFLIGGDTYTAYSFIAVPALIFSSGALGFFAVPYLSIIYPIVFLVLPRFWIVARHCGYVTPADFVRERFDSRILTVLVSVTGIMATMPYLALQIYGMEVSIAQMGVPIEISLFIAFLILAGYTYVSGLRAPALIALVKDLAIWLVVLVAIIYIPIKLGGFGNIFAAVHRKALENPKTFHDLLPSSQFSEYVTLIIGSALALFLYPHTLTGILSSNSHRVVKRNAALLPAYTVLIALVGLLGYVAIAAGIQGSSAYGANSILPSLFSAEFPSWFAGFAFAAIAIGALTPAAIMSIGAANLFTRNIYREYFRPDCTEHEEARVAKAASLLVKIGALTFILLLPSTLAINFQLLSNIWIVQTFPAVFLGLYTNWFHRRALSIGLAAGLITGTWMVIAQQFRSSVFPVSFGNFTIPMYAAVVALVVNLLLCVVLTPLCQTLGIPDGKDATIPTDFDAEPVLNTLQGLAQPPKEGFVQPFKEESPQQVPQQTQPHRMTQQLFREESPQQVPQQTQPYRMTQQLFREESPQQVPQQTPSQSRTMARLQKISLAGEPHRDLGSPTRK